jgi:thioredoxin reductase
MLIALRLTQDKVTVFTNGEGVATDEAGQMRFEIAAARGVKFDHRPLKSISQNPHGVGIQLNFQDGSNESIRMLMSTPPSVNRAADLISSLGLETLPGSDGHVVSKSMMGESSLPGCFVAGDTSTAAKIVHIAMSSGKGLSKWTPGRYCYELLIRSSLLGTLAGIGVAKQLAHEEGLKALKTMSRRGSQGHL